MGAGGQSGGHTSTQHVTTIHRRNTMSQKTRLSQTRTNLLPGVPSPRHVGHARFLAPWPEFAAVVTAEARFSHNHRVLWCDARETNAIRESKRAGEQTLRLRPLRD
jgi:hypothetical protein